MHTLQQLKDGELKGMSRVRLAAGLTEFPQQLFELADTLEVLDLSGNQLQDLPEHLPALHKLKILFLSENNFTEVPEVIGRCARLEMVGFKSNRISRIHEKAFPPKLRWLILTNNQLKHLPSAIGKCAHLQKLMLAGNRLQELPEEMSQCRKLELVRISANQLKVLPTWLLSLPRLSWLATSGNPFSKNRIVASPSEISWKELTLTHLLGEGASGIISKATWKNDKEQMEVAVKIFKGEVTSDGLPYDEMNACIAAGTHPNLVSVIGKIKHHTENKQGLVMHLIPSHYKNLGGPPSFQTCTRDTFPDQLIFSLKEIIRIGSEVASVLQHLHTSGIMHGDLYAHNILVDETKHPLFGDFGAASFYDHAMPEAAALQRLEVRAFGCLLDDLLARIADDARTHPLTLLLIQLKEDCMQEQIMNRPGFGLVYKQMALMKAND